MESKNETSKPANKPVINNHHSGGNAVYVIGLVGAAIYNIQIANPDFWSYIVAILKSLVWPAFVVYKLLGL